MKPTKQEIVNAECTLSKLFRREYPEGLTVFSRSKGLLNQAFPRRDER